MPQAVLLYTGRICSREQHKSYGRKQDGEDPKAKSVHDGCPS